jgi:hypothetical protein
MFEAKKSERAEGQHQENNAYLKQLGGLRKGTCSEPEIAWGQKLLKAQSVFGGPMCPQDIPRLTSPYSTKSGPMLFFSGWWRSTGNSSTR